MKNIKEYINEAYQATYLKRWQPIEKLYDKRHIGVGDDNILGVFIDKTWKWQHDRHGSIYVGMFNKDEISTLNRIIETNSEDIIKCGAYILLDDYHNAQKCLEKLSEKEQEEFKKFPIYYFVKSHNQPPKS